MVWPRGGGVVWSRGVLQIFGGGLHRNTVNVRPIRILLECILVYDSVTAENFDITCRVVFLYFCSLDMFNQNIFIPIVYSTSLLHLNVICMKGIFG